ncbi:hypothetical protein PF004_g30783 [Phytophthora fragariae]|uniref:Uncharacterized protein n=1 Tax=Phytophthora fragariae TaxID=53985 RepID=A0A6G0MBN3_9STRA|nr:hypothetical protein PF004_g30783 [Phytophthora fragariae]
MLKRFGTPNGVVNPFLRCEPPRDVSSRSSLCRLESPQPRQSTRAQKTSRHSGKGATGSAQNLRLLPGQSQLRWCHLRSWIASSERETPQPHGIARLLCPEQVEDVRIVKAKSVAHGHLNTERRGGWYSPMDQLDFLSLFCSS